MKVFEIVCHDGKRFMCKEQEELENFVENYRRLEGDRIRREFPKKQFLVDHVETIEIDEEDYISMPASTESVAYFNGLEV